MRFFHALLGSPTARLWWIMTPPHSYWPTWLSVLRVLKSLGDDAPVTLESFRATGEEHVWHWAVRARGPDGPSGPHPGPSPWLTLVAGQCARDVRIALPLFVANRCLPRVTVKDITQEAIRSPDLQRRHRLGYMVAGALAKHPDDWRWLSELLSALDPDPFGGDGDDSRDVLEDLFGDRPRSAAKRSPSADPPKAPPISVSGSPQSGGHTRSTRPVLRRLRERDQ